MDVQDEIIDEFVLQDELIDDSVPEELIIEDGITEDNIGSDEVVVVAIQYDGEETDNIIVYIDNKTRKITATIKPIQYETKASLPEIGSDRLLYLVTSENNTIYRWNAEIKDYEFVTKDYSFHLQQLDDDVETLQKQFDSLDSIVAQHTKEIKKNKEDIAVLQDDVIEIQDELTKHEADIIGLRNDVDSLEKTKIDDVKINGKSAVFAKVANLTIELEQDKDSSLIYYLKVNNENVGTINIPKDQFLKSVSPLSEDYKVTFTWETSDGEQTTTVDFKALVDVYKAGDGLDLVEGTFSVKLDPNTNAALTVSENGLKLDLTEIAEEITQLGNEINSIEQEIVNISNQIDDIEENYATKEYVEQHGGKIDSISVDGVPQEIDENKNVDIKIGIPADIQQQLEQIKNSLPTVVIL